MTTEAVTEAQAVAPTEQQTATTADDSRLTELTKELEDARGKLGQIESAKAEEERKKAIEQGELQKLLDSDKRKYEEDIKSKDDQIRAYQQTIADQQRNALIKESAAELMTSEWQWLGELILKDRIGVALDAKGQTKTIIYDENRQKTNLSIDKLKEQIQGDKRIERFLKGADVGSGSKTNETMLSPVQPTFGAQQPNQQQQPQQFGVQQQRQGILQADAKEVSKWVQQRIKSRR